MLHTSDWHLGRFLHGKSLLDDQEAALQSLIDLIDRRRPHALLISGDVFDRSLPPEAAVTLFDRFLFEVALKRDLPVCLIPGNHDSRERLGFAASLLHHRRVYIFAHLSDTAKPVTIHGDGGTKAVVYGLPFVEPVQIAHYLGNDGITTADEATRAICATMLTDRSPQDLKVLLCHALVMGGESSESEKELFIGGSSTVHAQAFDGFHYAALGHLHKPQLAGSARVRYSGSLLPYSKSEVGHKKSVTEVVLDPSGEISLHEHPLQSKRRLLYLEGTLEELLSGSHDAGVDDHVLIGLSDRGAVLDAFAKLRVRFPGLLHVARTADAVSSNQPGVTRERLKQNVNQADLFAEFYSTCTGSDLSSEEKEQLLVTIRDLARAEDAP